MIRRPYVFVRLRFWHRWLRPLPRQVRAPLPEEATVRYAYYALGVLLALVGISVGLLTAAEELRLLL
jgi:hypothetical protein